jgi:hypothetical protein
MAKERAKMAKVLSKGAAKPVKGYTWPKAKAGAVKSVPGISDASLRVIRGTTDSMRLALKRLADK